MVNAVVKNEGLNHGIAVCQESVEDASPGTQCSLLLRQTRHGSNPETQLK